MTCRGISACPPQMEIHGAAQWYVVKAGLSISPEGVHPSHVAQVFGWLSSDLSPPESPRAAVEEAKPVDRIPPLCVVFALLRGLWGSYGLFTHFPERRPRG